MKVHFIENVVDEIPNRRATDTAEKSRTTAVDRRERRHAEFFDVINSSLKIDSPEHFCQWVQGDLQYVFPHAMLACGFGLFGGQQASIEQIVTCNFPSGYLDDLNLAGGLSASPVVTQWAQTRKPVIFEPAQSGDDSQWMGIFRKYGMHNIAAHGLCDLSSHTTSYFSFFNIPVTLTPKHAQLLEMLIPHLHVALARALGNAGQVHTENTGQENSLTKREKEILRWMSSGKTNGEIAKALHISENTVKNHVQRVLEKLKVTSRTEAVALGLKKAIV